MLHDRGSRDGEFIAVNARVYARRRERAHTRIQCCAHYGVDSIARGERR